MSDFVEDGQITNAHFTYSLNPDYRNLCQGDVLEVTSDLRNVMNEVHPYFDNDQYKYFIVLTQSCDLYRRDGKHCKSSYITLAAVRTFDSFFERVLIDNHYLEIKNGIRLLDVKNSTKVYQLIERVFNNTEPEYFFLYKEPLLRFNESMVAYLKVSVALKADLHYDTCISAKRIELADEFKAKLGWLVGNIYSRVGTKDWDGILGSDQKALMIKNEIESRCLCAKKEQIKELKKEIDSQGLQLDEAKERLNSIHVKTTYEKVIDAVSDALSTTGKHIKKEDRDKVLNDIKSRSVLKLLLKDDF